MLPYFVQIPNVITAEEIQYLESFLHDSMQNDSANFISYDTISGKKDGNLCWDYNIELFNRFPLQSYNFFVKQKANTKVQKHKDNPKWKRNTVLIVPLFWHKNYAACVFSNGIIVTHENPIIMNTQFEHYVNNNDNDRYNFQICFEEPIEKVYECLIQI